MGKNWDNFSDKKKSYNSQAERDAHYDRYGKGASPYGYSSSSGVSTRKERDNFIAFMTEVFAEALRVIRPGGHALIWALPRTSGWTQRALEDAGWECRDVIHHIYSADTVLHNFLATLSQEQQEAFECLIDSQASSTCYHLFGSGFPKSLDVSKAIDAHLRVEREIVGSYDRRGIYDSCERTSKGDTGTSQCSGRSSTVSITAPATEFGKRHAGFGSNLKPAAEHWLLVRKPLSEPTIAENVLKYGTGALNIDASRIPGYVPQVTQGITKGAIHGNAIYNNGHDLRKEPTVSQPHANGRFPSNLLLSHTLFCTEGQCTEDCPIVLLDQQSGTRKSGAVRHYTGEVAQRNIYATSVFSRDSEYKASEGGASRFFQQFYYSPKASQSERNLGCEDLPEQNGFDKNTSKQIAHINHQTGAITYTEYTPSLRKNHHPCVKSLSLMKYLISLVTPPSGVVLDMFCGSGSTLCAAVYEHFHFIGIDQSEEYCAIASARVAYAQQHIKET